MSTSNQLKSLLSEVLGIEFTTKDIKAILRYAKFRAHHCHDDLSASDHPKTGRGARAAAHLPGQRNELRPENEKGSARPGG